MNIDGAQQALKGLRQHLSEGRSPDVYSIQTLTHLVAFLLEQIPPALVEDNYADLEQCERQDTNSIFISNVHGDLQLHIHPPEKREESTDDSRD